MSKRIVIALGGNALGNTAAQQLELVSLTAKPIVDLIAAGNEVIIAHGNGPQVGMINLGLSTAAEAGAIKSDMPFPECGAMSQGYIGYHLQNAIGNELTARGLRKDVATVVTQVLVDENDPAFQHPTKPIGSFYDKVAADRIMAQRGCTMVEDAGRGWRQVVPSPKRPSGRHARRHRQGFRLRQAGGTAERRYAHHPHRRGEGGHQLRQARPAVAQ